MFATFRYSYHGLKNPEARDLGFIDMGFGIESRQRRLAPYWMPHLSRCREIILSWLAENIDALQPKPSLTVLGAGRLYDIDLPRAATLCSRIDLIDADPSCDWHWRKTIRRIKECQVRRQILDLTGVLSLWHKALAYQIEPRQWDACLVRIRDIPQLSCSLFPESYEPPRSSLALIEPSDFILSLNILSQLPLVWQGLVERALHQVYEPDQLKSRQEEWLDAARVGGEILVRQHLRDLGLSASRQIMLISDVEYAHYSSPIRYTAKGPDRPPVTWLPAEGDRALQTAATGHGSWQEDKELLHRHGRADGLNSSNQHTCEVFNALAGFDLEDNSQLGALLPDYETSQPLSWLWHISPQGLESQRRGVLHRVAAWRFTKK